jgi:hypothetical protein
MPEMDDDDEGEGEGGFEGMNLLPPGMAPSHNAMSPLEQLRHHPQFNALREVLLSLRLSIFLAVSGLQNDVNTTLFVLVLLPRQFLVQINSL